MELKTLENEAHSNNNNNNNNDNEKENNPTNLPTNLATYQNTNYKLPTTTFNADEHTVSIVYHLASRIQQQPTTNNN